MCPRLRTLLALGLFVIGLAWGAHTCLYHLNRVLDPPQPIRALQVQRLDDRHLACTVLGVDLVLAWPADWWAGWSAPVGG